MATHTCPWSSFPFPLTLSKSKQLQHFGGRAESCWAAAHTELTPDSVRLRPGREEVRESQALDGRAPRALAGDQSFSTLVSIGWPWIRRGRNILAKTTKPGPLLCQAPPLSQRLPHLCKEEPDSLNPKPCHALGQSPEPRE